MRSRLIPVFILAVVSSTANALQVKGVVDNETTAAKISSSDVTRIFVQGDRIKSLKGIKGAYTRENDESNGEVYIQPTADYQYRAFTVLIDTESGRHFTLLLNPISAPSETLMLVPKGVGSQQAGKFENATPYELTINHLIKSMKDGEVPSGYSVSQIEDKKIYKFGNQFTAKLMTIYRGLNLHGEIYDIKNISSKEIQIDERQFYKNGARAISLDQVVLQPNETVDLYEVISND